MPGQELQNFRKKYPQYSDINDFDLANMLAKKYPESYGDLPEKHLVSNVSKNIVETVKSNIPSLLPKEEKKYTAVSESTNTPVAQGKAAPTPSVLSQAITPAEDIMGGLGAVISVPTDYLAQTGWVGKEIAQGIKQPFENADWLMNQGSDLVARGLSSIGIDLPKVGTPEEDKRLQGLANNTALLVAMGKAGKPSIENDVLQQREVLINKLREKNAPEVKKDLISQIKEKDNQLETIKKEKQNAETVRSNEGQVQETRTIGEVSKGKGSERFTTASTQNIR